MVTTGVVARKTTTGAAADAVEKQQSVAAVVYPNPVKENLHIRLAHVSKGANIKVYNTMGAMVIMAPIHSSTQTLSFQHLPAGLYHVVINNGNNVINKKVFKG